MPDYQSPYVRDPQNPTDAELSAAIDRDLRAGRLMTVEEFFTQAEAIETAQAQAQAETELEAAS